MLIIYKTHTYNYSFAIWACGSIAYPEKLKMIKRQSEEVAEREEEREERESVPVLHASHISCVLT